jgi:membrane associated rhomboid family serine protease
MQSEPARRESHSSHQHLILLGGSFKEVMDISLMLASQKMPHRIVYEENTYGIEVPADSINASLQLIKIYREENRGWRESLQPPEKLTLSPAPFLFLIIPSIGFFFQTHSEFNGTLLTNLGRCDAAKILSGEVWRVFTGLTLHGSLQHYASNMVSGYFIINLLIHRVNTGLSLLCITVLSGLANFLTALHTGPNHLSLGYSTSVFAALGFMAVEQARRQFFRKSDIQKPWTPIVAAFFIVVMVGISPGADIHAHMYGFAAGVLGGAGLAGFHERTKKWWKQAALTAGAYGIFGLCWWLALT